MYILTYSHMYIVIRLGHEFESLKLNYVNYGYEVNYACMVPYALVA